MSNPKDIKSSLQKDILSEAVPAASAARKASESNLIELTDATAMAHQQDPYLANRPAKPVAFQDVAKSAVEIAASGFQHQMMSLIKIQKALQQQIDHQQLRLGEALSRLDERQHRSDQQLQLLEALEQQLEEQQKSVLKSSAELSQLVTESQRELADWQAKYHESEQRQVEQAVEIRVLNQRIHAFVSAAEAEHQQQLEASRKQLQQDKTELKKFVINQFTNEVRGSLSSEESQARLASLREDVDALKSVNDYTQKHVQDIHMLIDATTDQRLAKQSNDFRTLVDSVKQDTSIRLQNIRAEAKAERDTIKAELVQDANSAAQVAAENAVELVLAKGLADQVGDRVLKQMMNDRDPLQSALLEKVTQKLVENALVNQGNNTNPLNKFLNKLIAQQVEKAVVAQMNVQQDMIKDWWAQESEKQRALRRSQTINQFAAAAGTGLSLDLSTPRGGSAVSAEPSPSVTAASSSSSIASPAGAVTRKPTLKSALANTGNTTKKSTNSSRNGLNSWMEGADDDDENRNKNGHDIDDSDNVQSAFMNALGVSGVHIPSYLMIQDTVHWRLEVFFGPKPVDFVLHTLNDFIHVRQVLVNRHPAFDIPAVPVMQSPEELKLLAEHPHDYYDQQRLKLEHFMRDILELPDCRLFMARAFVEFMPKAFGRLLAERGHTRKRFKVADENSSSNAPGELVLDCVDWLLLLKGFGDTDHEHDAEIHLLADVSVSKPTSSHSSASSSSSSSLTSSPLDNCLVITIKDSVHSATPRTLQRVFRFSSAELLDEFEQAVQIFAAIRRQKTV